MSQEKTVKKQEHIIPSLLFSLITIISGGLFGYQVIKMHILPDLYNLAFCGIIACLCLLLTLFLFLKKRSILAKLLSLLLSVLMLAGAAAAYSANTILSEVSSVNISTDIMGVYVMNDDPAQSIADAKDYTFGILQGLDRPNTDLCLSSIEEELGAPVAYHEYISVLNLADAMMEGEVDAILLNSGYLSLLEDDEERYQFLTDIRLIWSHEIVRDLSPAVKEEPEEEETPRSSFVVYLSGNDSAGALSSVGRSDVNILMAVNPNTSRILLVNTPRDYYVETPVSGEDRDKLTHAGIYGVDVSMSTLSNLYHIPVDHYIRLNFSGFTQIIDALGGITVCNDTEFSSRGYYYPIGNIDLSGDAALAFARERYSFIEGDRKRGENQQAVIAAVIRKVASPAILTNYTQLLKAVGGAFETDLSQDEIAELVQRQLSDGTDWQISSIAVDGSNDIGNNFSMPNSHVYRMIPNWETVDKAEKQLREVLGLPARTE